MSPVKKELRNTIPTSLEHELIDSTQAIEKFKSFMEQESLDVNACNQDGLTPMHFLGRVVAEWTSSDEACKAIENSLNYVAIIQYLLDKGADINAQDNLGRTILDSVLDDSYSSWLKSKDVAFLIEQGANFNKPNKGSLCNAARSLGFYLKRKAEVKSDYSYQKGHADWIKELKTYTPEALESYLHKKNKDDFQRFLFVGEEDYAEFEIYTPEEQDAYLIARGLEPGYYEEFETYTPEERDAYLTAHGFEPGDYEDLKTIVQEANSDLRKEVEAYSQEESDASVQKALEAFQEEIAMMKKSKILQFIPHMVTAWNKITDASQDEHFQFECDMSMMSSSLSKFGIVEGSDGIWKLEKDEPDNLDEVSLLCHDIEALQKHITGVKTEEVETDLA